MNIVLYVNSFLPSVGGKEIVVHYLARELHRLGHKVRVVGPSGWIKLRKLQFGYPVHRWPTLRGRFYDNVMYAQMYLDMKFWGCDVVHAHTTYPNGYLVSLLKLKHKLPLVITPHGHDIHVIPELGFGHRLDPVKRRKIEQALKSAELVTAISDSVESSLIDAGCSTDKIRKIPNGIDIERFQINDSQNIRQWLELEKDARLILSVGNYHPRKGQDFLIEAMPRILSQVPDARLVLVGGSQNILAEKVRALKLEKFVRLTGAISFPNPAAHNKIERLENSEDRLAALYCQSQVYVSASINKEAEGLSLAMLDAMAAGLPIVASQISGSSDIVIDGKTGFLVPPADAEGLAGAIIAVLDQKNASNEMGRAGKLIAQRFHWREIAGQYLAVYQEAIEKTGHHSKYASDI